MVTQQAVYSAGRASVLHIAHTPPAWPDACGAHFHVFHGCSLFEFLGEHLLACGTLRGETCRRIA